MAQALNPQIIAELKAAAGEGGWLESPADLESFLTEWRGLYRGDTPLVLMPASVDQVAAIIGICAAHDIAIVPQGGNTGLAGGAIPGLATSRPEVLLSSRRLKTIHAIDLENFTVTVEAGVVLAELQAAVEAAGLYFPLSLAAEGSCCIGGNISTNAGGTNVLRYGNTRDLVLGLEVVLADGSVWNGLSGLRKDNTGYDLKQLFIGAEGTLGFITAATLKLFPLASSRSTAWLAVTSPEAAVRLYSEARRYLGDEMVAFELMPQIAIDMVLEHLPGARNPLGKQNADVWHVLVEFSSARQQEQLDEQLLNFLQQCLEKGQVVDGSLAGSVAQRDEFWSVRHGISEAQKKAGGSIKHDISVPVSRLAEFLTRANALVAAALPGVRPVPFGHLGDGNLHYNLSQPVAMDPQRFVERWGELNRIVHTLAVELGGSFSAEHGIGYLKAGELERLKSAEEMALMRAIKQALDPQGIMNPGKVLAAKSPDS